MKFLKIAFPVNEILSGFAFILKRIEIVLNFLLKIKWNKKFTKFYMNAK